IGLIVPDVEHPYALEILKGVNRAIADKEFDLLVYTTGNFQKHDTIAHEQHYVSLLNGTITDGVMVVTPAAAEFSTTAPIVLIDPHVVDQSHPAVLATHYAGAMEAMQYLTSLNHRRIGYISGRPGLQNTERYQAYQDALAKVGVALDPDLVTEGDYSTKTAADCAMKLLSLSNPPTAIFAANDQSAIGVFQSAKELGFRVPQDLSVIGFDNIPEAEYFDLTTIDQSLAKMGTLAAEMLIKLVKKEQMEQVVYKMPTTLIVRKSCQEATSITKQG
ncbi:MAG: substrate-binding domain-containing protein, partial [Anaerolineaceae bacterium]|nr:substrate-binding domain-containing protein [Anaerolineaceae bacterium]